jgi:hypothetical protein
VNRRGVLLVLALVLSAAAATSGFIALGKVRRQVAVGEICDATRESRWADAIAFGEGTAGPDAEGRVATECLCWAYGATDQLGKCTDLVERVLAEPGGADWVPDITIARELVRTRRDAGHVPEAAEFARRASQAYPNDSRLLELELTTRALVEDEGQVIEDMKKRMPADLEASMPLRIVLAAAYERRANPDAELAILGETPPPQGHPAVESWFEGRANGFASKMDAKGLKDTYARWEAMGGDPVELRARYAIRVSLYGVEDPEYSQFDLLKKALDEEEQLKDDMLRRTLYERVMGRLLVDGKVEEALAVYDRAAKRYPGLIISRDEILRTAEAGKAREGAQVPVDGTLIFAAEPGSASGTLHISPDAGAPGDAPYEPFALAPGKEVRVQRKRTQHPVRWVLRDASERPLASGTVWPEHEPQRVAVHGVESTAPVPAHFEPTLRKGDGRRRVFVIINDCEDWRVLQYLRERGEMPVHDELLRTGYRAVLTSTPAFTGAAMESLVWPTRGRSVSFVGLANRLGIELEGLSSVDRNPLEFLQPLLPEGENLFERVGAEDHVAANFLFSHGYIDAGRNAELIGPAGRRRPASKVHALRPLRPEESAGLPAPLATQQKYRGEVEKIAAELDTATVLARDGEIDFMVLRVEPLDILTHGFFSEMLRPGQDDGGATLLWAYRYIDQRLGEIWNSLDDDDVFIVMSDHGIRTSLEHEEDAIFVAVGGGLPRTRVDGSPHLRGVASFLAGLFGIDTTWPDTGLGKAALAAR